MFDAPKVRGSGTWRGDEWHLFRGLCAWPRGHGVGGLQRGPHALPWPHGVAWAASAQRAAGGQCTHRHCAGRQAASPAPPRRGPSPPGPSQADPDRSSEEQSSAPYESQIICPTGSCPNAGLRSHELLQRADGWQLRTPDFSRASNGLCSQAEVPALSAEAPSPCPTLCVCGDPAGAPPWGWGWGPGGTPTLPAAGPRSTEGDERWWLNVRFASNPANTQPEGEGNRIYAEMI